MSIYARLEDFVAWSGRSVDPDQAAKVQFLLDEAEVELEVVAGDLGVRIDAELTTEDRVKLAVLGMVGRVLRDGDVAEKLIGDGEHTPAQDAGEALSRWLRVTRRERHLVGMASRGGSLDLSTLDLQLAKPFRSDWAIRP